MTDVGECTTVLSFMRKLNSLVIALCAVLQAAFNIEVSKAIAMILAWGIIKLGTRTGGARRAESGGGVEVEVGGNAVSSPNRGPGQSPGRQAFSCILWTGTLWLFLAFQ